MKVYLEDEDDKKNDNDNDKRLPELNKGDVLDLNEINMTQHFTEPPPRYTEASLVKALEEHGIGRPSTYASIISTLQNREYVEMDARRFTPTDVGSVVNKFLSKQDELDAVSRGEKEWVPLMKDFWTPFNAQVQDKEENVTREEAVASRELGKDPETGKPVTVRIGRYGPFVQIGTKEDEEKPNLRPGQKMDKITFDEAMILFQLPRKLGETPEGEKVTVSIGRFGPYVKYDSKYASIKEDDPYTITLERALEIVEEKKEADRNKVVKVFEEDPEIQIHNGRWGAYLTNGSKNAKLTKEQKEAPLEIDFATAKKLIDEAPEKRGRGKKKAVAKKAAAKKKSVAKKKTSKKKASKKKASAKKKSAAKKKASAKKAAAKKTKTEKSDDDNSEKVRA